MEAGACAVGPGLLQPQTGRPVTDLCTAQGLIPTASNADTEHREYKRTEEPFPHFAPLIHAFVHLSAFCGGAAVLSPVQP